ncbi:MAG: autoinducer-2 kinase [Armatimonadota bacterium]|nr:autoinducer-2 kinase [Armatimonadota bacterium]MDR7558646.1 autoinducer-2 kinase [Armatimonadota bacterium]
MPRYLLTVDAGTGSGRCVIFDLDGRQVAMAQREWVPRSLPEYPGSQEFDTEEAWAILSDCIRRAVAAGGIRPEEIAGVTATSMREGMVLYDAEDQVLWACPNLDARATREAEEMIRAGLADEIYRIGGDWVNIIAPPRFWWLRRHRADIYSRIARMSMLSDWVLFRLTGRIVTDPTIGSSSGLFDLTRRTWSQELIERLDLPRGIYPPVFESGTVVGEVMPRAAEATGLRAGTPVVTSGADTQCGLVGVGAITPGSWVVVGGTQWQTAVITDRPLIDPQARPRTLCHAVPGQWMTEGIGFYHGFSTRWFRDAFCQSEVELAHRLGVDPYWVLEKMAEQVPPGSHGLIAIFSDVMVARRWKHAAPSFLQFDVLSPHTSGKKECYRALEENAAYVSYGNYLVLTELAGRSASELVFCGGSSKGFLWPQIMADVYGIPVKVPVVKEATSLGAAMIMGRALGFYSSLEEATAQLVAWERRFDPSPSAHAAYQEHYRRWRAVYPRMLQLVDEGLLAPMWRAPGT